MQQEQMAAAEQAKADTASRKVDIAESKAKDESAIKSSKVIDDVRRRVREDKGIEQPQNKGGGNATSKQRKS